LRRGEPVVEHAPARANDSLARLASFGIRRPCHGDAGSEVRAVMNIGLSLPAEPQAHGDIGPYAPVVLIEEAGLDLSNLGPGVSRRDRKLRRHAAQRANLRRRVSQLLE